MTSFPGMERIDRSSVKLPGVIRFVSSMHCRRPPDAHAVDYFMRQVGGGDGAIPRIDVPRIDSGFIAIHPYSGSKQKNWPHFAELASRIDKPVRFCVGPEQSWPEGVRYNDLYELAKWLATRKPLHRQRLRHHAPRRRRWRARYRNLSGERSSDLVSSEPGCA